LRKLVSVQVVLLKNHKKENLLGREEKKMPGNFPAQREIRRELFSFFLKEKNLRKFVD
jgi:hypothetical protein